MMSIETGYLIGYAIGSVIKFAAIIIVVGYIVTKIRKYIKNKKSEKDEDIHLKK